MTKKVSIIIPIYNSGFFLEKCLDCLIQQTYKNLEIICVNDGSTDCSKDILKKYQEYDSRIIVINKENTGVSDTRNLGTLKSTGDFVMYVDADDYIDDNYIEKLLNVALNNSSELVISGYTKITDSITEKKTTFKNLYNEIIDITYPKFENRMFLTFEFNPCWKQLIKRDLIVDNNLHFDKNIKYGEDFLFSAMCYVNSQKTSYIVDFGYNYIITDNSAMRKKNIDACIKYFDDNYRVLENIMQATGIKFNKYVNYKILLGFNYGARRLYNSLDKKKYSEFKKYIKQERYDYSKYYDFYKLSHRLGSIKEEIQFLLVKYKFYFIYYLVKKYF